MADLGIFEGQITHPAGSQQETGLRAVRVDAGSPEVVLPVERESDSRAKNIDQAGAEQSGPAPNSSPAASSPQAASTLRNEPPTQGQGNAACAEGLSPRACSNRSESQQTEPRARCKAAPLGGALQTANKGESHSPAESEGVPALSCAHAVPALSAAHAAAASSHAALAAAQKALPVSHESASQEKVLPPIDAAHEPCQQTVSASIPAGRFEADVTSAVARAHTDVPDANVKTVHVKRDASVRLPGSMSNFCQGPFGENRHGIMLGKRKRARKSTKSEHEPAGSVQQSNALLLQSSEPKTSSAALSIDGQDEATYDACSNKACATDEVIDLTGPGD